MEPIITVRDVVKEYIMGEVKIRAADGISFEVDTGELVVVLGPSGAGKSTVLNILGGMDFPTSGEVWVNGKDISKFNRNELTMYRRKHIGFVFQFYNLMPNLTALENVEIAAQICDDPLDPVSVLKEVGLDERMTNFPAQLSGGEQQRVSIARAVAKNPTLLLCDEPTGALDYMTGKSILKLLSDVNREFKKTVMIITHNSPLAQMADKVVRIKNGKVESVELNDSPLPIERIEW
jgi:putative ABC transport system ATP-binding protein